MHLGSQGRACGEGSIGIAPKIGCTNHIQLSVAIAGSGQSASHDALRPGIGGAPIEQGSDSTAQGRYQPIQPIHD